MVNIRVLTIAMICRRAFSFLRLPGRCRVSLQHRSVRLPPRGASVTGVVYEDPTPEAAPKVTLFTKEGCTLCDKVKDVLSQVREMHPHSLSQVDITDDVHTDWFDKYKYDIPVLHVNGMYWTKHRLTEEEAVEGLEAAQTGSFESPKGEPNAAEMERK